MVIIMELKNKKINFLGDSITEGVGTTEKEHIFLNVIGNNESAVCRNYGISGTRIARQQNKEPNNPFDNDFCARFPEMDKDADIVVVFGGTNDFGHGDAPIGNPEDRTPDTFYGALHTLYSGLITMYPESVIMVMTPLHRCNEDNPRGDGGKPENVGTLKKYVDIIREVAEFYSLPVLDLFALSGLQPRVPVIQEKYIPDGLHPNDAGHKIIASRLTAFLKAL